MNTKPLASLALEKGRGIFRLTPNSSGVIGMVLLARCLLLGTTHAESAYERSGIAALRGLKIESGSIQFLEHDDNPAVTINGCTIANVPPRTVLKILLNPAQGSNINVEIWLPDQIDFGKDIDAYIAILGPYLNAENPDLSAYERRGGKLMMISGATDSTVPYHATLDYYERVIEHFGDIEKVRSFCRFYLIPGMGHGGQATGLGGPPNTLKMVMDWREKGTAPNEVICRRVVEGKTEVEMPVYPYPQQAAWDAGNNVYRPVEGPRRGVDRVAESFRPDSRE